MVNVDPSCDPLLIYRLRSFRVWPDKLQVERGREREGETERKRDNERERVRGRKTGRQRKRWRRRLSNRE